MSRFSHINYNRDLNDEADAERERAREEWEQKEQEEKEAGVQRDEEGCYPNGPDSESLLPDKSRDDEPGPGQG